MKTIRVFLLLVAVVALTVPEASAAVVYFGGNLAGFNLAAGSPGVAIDFDAIAPGTNIAGSTIAGVTFSNPDGNPLSVVAAASTFSGPGFAPPGDADNVLPATSGLNVLSPGGPELVAGPALGQRDSLTLAFASPVSAFGLDVLFQSLDGASFFGYAIYDTNSVLLASNGFIPVPALPNGSDPTSPSSAGGAYFVGFVSDSANIGTIVFSEFDDNEGNPDSNVGYDTFRFAAAPVPEPGVSLLLGAGLTAIVAAFRRR
jgi:hypothetical protein